MKTITIALASLIACGVAAANPLRVRGGTPVRLVLPSGRLPAIGVTMKGSGWRLDLGATANEVAEVSDVTSGSRSEHWRLEVLEGGILLDKDTFIAGHAYLVMLRSGSQTVGSAYVYLVPPKRTAIERVNFSGSEDDTSGDLRTLRKPSL